MALHPWTQLQMQHRRESIVRGLLERPREEVDALFARFDATCARFDAVKAGDWVKYVELGGDIEIARKADPLSFPVVLSDFD